MNLKDLDTTNGIPSQNKNIRYSSDLLTKEFIRNKDIYSYISHINEINQTIEFLINMNNSKLMVELYRLMENQIRIYDVYGCSRVLELTAEQFKIFKKYNIGAEMFEVEPFSVDSILVYEIKMIDYKYFNSEAEIDSFISNYNKKQCDSEGLYFLTSASKNSLGSGLYVCNKNDEVSDCLFNNLIMDRLGMLSRNSDGYIYFLEGQYTGLIKRCIYGELKGMYVLMEELSNKPVKNKEELCLYGDIDIEGEILISKDEEFNLKLQENLPDYKLKLSCVKDEIIEGAKG